MSDPPLRSALYEGTVTHRRRDPDHRFTQRVTMPLLFTDELAASSRLHPLVQFDPAGPSRWHHAVRLARSDLLAPQEVTVPEAVAGRVESVGGTVRGPVAVLGHVRTWGWLFNPLTVYYCFDEAGEAVDWAVLEVSNTPWHERHAYVIGPPGPHRVAKSLHVSPFLPMGAEYEIFYSPPGPRLTVRIDVQLEGGERALSATMHLRRRPLDREGLAHLLWRRPAMTARVSAGIYAQAARLATLGATFHRHPRARVPVQGGVRG